jgi:hypothetical protein
MWCHPYRTYLLKACILRLKTQANRVESFIMCRHGDLAQENCIVAYTAYLAGGGHSFGRVLEQDVLTHKELLA